MQRGSPFQRLWLINDMFLISFRLFMNVSENFFNNCTASHEDPRTLMALPYHYPSQIASVHHPLPSRRKGYAQVAEFIATDKELAIYHRFDRTAARILLILQSQILYKQTQLDGIDEEDATDKDEKRQLALGVIQEETSQSPDARDIRRNELYRDLKLLLKEYCGIEERQYTHCSRLIS